MPESSLDDIEGYAGLSHHVAGGVAQSVEAESLQSELCKGRVVDAQTEIGGSDWSDLRAERAVQAGARLTKEPTDAEFFKGRDTYFADRKVLLGSGLGAGRQPCVEALRRATGGSHATLTDSTCNSR